MSWQEKIEKYIKEEELKKDFSKKKESEQKVKFYEERVPSLLKVIDDYNCINLLKEIRDEVWGQGEVSIKKPKIEELDLSIPSTLRNPLMVSALLTTEFPCYKSGYYRDDPHDSYMGSEWVDSPHIEIKTEALAIHAVCSKDLNLYLRPFFNENRDDNVLIQKVKFKDRLPDFLFIINHEDEQINKYESIDVDESFFIEVNEKEKTIEALEKILIKDCAGRNKSTFKYNAQEIVRMIDSGKNLTFPTRFEYLLDSAKNNKKRNP